MVVARAFMPRLLATLRGRASKSDREKFIPFFYK
jgi:hypothetical protein